MKVDVYKIQVVWEVIGDSKVDASGSLAALLGRELWDQKASVKVGDAEKVDVPEKSS